MRAFCPPKNTPDKDIVMTPEYLAKDIIQHYEPKGLILDPCRGTGAFMITILHYMTHYAQKIGVS